MYPSDLETTIRQTLPGIYPWLDQQPSPSMVHTAAAIRQATGFSVDASIDLAPQAFLSPAKKAKGKGRSPKPPKVIDVGCHVGRVIRQHRAAEATAPAAPGTGSSKRPHSRRAHWHHYWTGPKADPSKRTLVLKWVPPTFIHAGKPSDSKPTLRRIAPEKTGK